MNVASNAPQGEMTGGMALAHMLQAHEAGYIFGMGGFQLLPFYEACRQLGLQHHLINDERCGIFAADAYARITGKPGIVDATLGPGATNLATGLVESFNAGVPIIAIIGDTNRSHAWKNMTQETRQLDILGPAAKEVIRIEDGNRIPEHLRRAFAVATSGRAGPVIVDVPEDIAHGEFNFAAEDFRIDAATMRIPARRWRPAAEDIERAASLLGKSKRPMMLVGGGVHLSEAWAETQGLAEQLNMPVAHTMSGKGSLACIHPLMAGGFGRYTRIANDLIEMSDCLLVVGCKLGEIATKRYTVPPQDIPLIHLDIDAHEIGRWARTDVALVGDAREGLRDLAAALAGDNGASRAEWAAEVPKRMKTWREEVAHDRMTSTERPINMGRLINELNNVMPENGVLVGDGGFAAHWTALLYDTKRAGRTYVANRGFASIGYGLPGSLGAQLALGNEVPVVGLTGDGGFNMVLGELETAKRMNANFTLVVVNNAASGYVKALQHAMYGEGAYQASDLEEMNYARIAQAMGCHGIRVEDPEKVADALREGITTTDMPTIIDCVVTRDPGQMLPAADNRAAKIVKGDRVA